MRTYYSNPETGCRTKKPDPRRTVTGHLPIIATINPWLFYTALILGGLYMAVVFI
jgi:hypothetical protein